MWKLQTMRRRVLARAGIFVAALVCAVLLFACSNSRYQVMLEPPEGSDEPAQSLFSVELPSGWEVINPRAGGDSWSGAFTGDGMTLNFLGGPFAVSDIYRTMAGGGDPRMESMHINFSVDINGQQATLVRPRLGGEGLTAMVLDLPGRRLVFTAEGLSEDEQEVAFNIYRSVRK